MSTTRLDRPPGWRPGDLIPGGGYARCHGCHRPWWYIEKVDTSPARHCVYHSTHSASFALCERCWQSSTTERRVQAYRWLFQQWGYEPGREDRLAREWQICEGNIRASAPSRPLDGAH